MINNGKTLLWFLVILILALPTYAKRTLAVLEIIPTADVAVSISEAQHITNELRRQATLTLPQDSFIVLTRDNLISLIPEDEEEADRLMESGAIGIGKAIGAEYVTQGYISVFDKLLSLSVELYEAGGGVLVGNVVIEAPNATELLRQVREHSPALFAKIAKSSIVKAPDPSQEPAPAALSEPAPVASSVPSHGGSFWTAKNTLRVAAFALSAAGIGLGLWQNGKAGDNDKEAAKLRSSASQALNEYGDGEEYKRAYSVYESKIDEVKSNEALRSGFYIGAGVFGVAGVVTFFF